MKVFLNIMTAIFLLVSLSACNQTNSSNGNKTPSSEAKTSKSGISTSDDEKKQTASTESKESSTNSTSTAGEQNQPSSSSSTSNVSVSNSNQVPATLVETVDGDTIKVNYNGKEETIRYLLIDTPEDKKPNTCIQPYSLEAANRNKQLVNSGRLTLEFEEKNKTDKYGRLLAYVFVNGQSVQETLLKEGYARVAYIYYPPYKYLSQYEADENIAKGKSLNIWSKSGYATSNGFVGCVSSTTTQQSSSSGTTQSAPTTPSPSESVSSSATEYFANCTELRKKYPNGVPKGHPAYQDKLDRDKDGFACEK